MDDIDSMLQGEDQIPTPASQAERKNVGPNSGNSIESTEGQNDEEVEFNSLSGSAQDRFRKIIRDLRQTREENEHLKRQPVYGQTPFGQVPPPPNPDIQEAVRKLSEVGIATKDEVRKIIAETLGTVRFDDELNKLEGELDGNDGRPRFTREEYEDYINRHPQYRNYLPRDVYSVMYDEELTEWKIAHRSAKPKTQSSSLKPTKTSVQDEEWTPEYIEQKIQEEGPSWYDRHKDKINQVLSKLGR
ncbi:MAG: hypothetical protein KGL39_54400 [Patescibacteria group bacterium]|nr:hypothetical protein [Patescibacteria group bacterium]